LAVAAHALGARRHARRHRHGRFVHLARRTATQNKGGRGAQR
jgi:hypothetical protein